VTPKLPNVFERDDITAPGDDQPRTFPTHEADATELLCIEAAYPFPISDVSHEYDHSHYP
jgi:hypothetical protein